MMAYADDQEVAQLKRQIQELQFAKDSESLAHEVNLKDAYLKVCKEVKLKKPDNVNTLEEIRHWTQTELRNVVKQRAVNENKVMELQVEVEDLKKQLQDEQNAREAAVKILQDHLTVKMEELRQQATDATDMNTRSEELEMQIADLHRNLRKAEESHLVLEKDLKQSEEEKQELRGKIAELEEKQKNWSVSCNDLDRVVKDKDAEIARLNSEMNQLKTDLMKQLADKQNSYEVAVKSLQDQLNAKITEMEQLRQRAFDAATGKAKCCIQ